MQTFDTIAKIQLGYLKNLISFFPNIIHNSIYLITIFSYQINILKILYIYLDRASQYLVLHQLQLKLTSGMYINYSQDLSPVYISTTARFNLWHVYQRQLKFTSGMFINYSWLDLPPVCVSTTTRLYHRYVYHLQVGFTFGMYINYNQSLPPACLSTTTRV